MPVLLGLGFAVCKIGHLVRVLWVHLSRIQLSSRGVKVGRCGSAPTAGRAFSPPFKPPTRESLLSLYNLPHLSLEKLDLL